jgi:hypothetical protein
VTERRAYAFDNDPVGVEADEGSAEPYDPTPGGAGGEVAGFRRLGEILGVSDRVIYNWYMRRADFPDPVIDKAPREGGGRPGMLFKVSEVEAWHANYKPGKPGRKPMAVEPEVEKQFMHQWPNGTVGPQHLWGPWYSKDARRGPKEPPTQYRQCQHPLCKGVEVREAPNA